MPSALEKKIQHTKPTCQGIFNGTLAVEKNINSVDFVLS